MASTAPKKQLAATEDSDRESHWAVPSESAVSLIAGHSQVTVADRITLILVFTAISSCKSQIVDSLSRYSRTTQIKKVLGSSEVSI